MTIKKSLLLTSMFLGIACNNSDDLDSAVDRGVVVTTRDLNTSTIDDVVNGMVVATVIGRTNIGLVTFSIGAQNPDGALRIDEITGDLIVENASLIDAATTPELSLTVNVRNGEISKTSNVTITVESAPVDNDGDGVLNTIDPDDNSPCFPVQNAGYIGFDATNATWMEADCDGDGILNTDEVSGGTDPYVNDTVACDNIADTTIWNGPLNITETTPFGAIERTSEDAISECGILRIADPLGFGPCSDVDSFLIEFLFTPDMVNNTFGTIEAVSQTYSCGFIQGSEFSATGTYDETTRIITVSYLLDDGLFPINGELIIEPQN